MLLTYYSFHTAKVPSLLGVQITRFLALILLLPASCLASPIVNNSTSITECSNFETMSNTTMENNMSWQWLTSSLSMGEAKVVATVCKTAIVLCSHCNWAPKWLLPLTFTNLGAWALKLGNGQKLEPTYCPALIFLLPAKSTSSCACHPRSCAWMASVMKAPSLQHILALSPLLVAPWCCVSVFGSLMLYW